MPALQAGKVPGCSPGLEDGAKTLIVRGQEDELDIDLVLAAGKGILYEDPKALVEVNLVSEKLQDRFKLGGQVGVTRRHIRSQLLQFKECQS